MADIRDTPGHAQVCGTCWLRQLGVEPELAAVIITVAAQFTWAAAVGSVMATGGVTVEMPNISNQALEAMFQRMRAMLAAPPSPEVAEAMRADHG